MHKLFKLVAISGMLALAIPAFSQAVEIHVRPPHPKHEVRITMPHAGMVWQGGYHRWDAPTNTYVWTPGVWADAPHAHARWVGPKYVHKKDHWEFQEGHWR
ncbi:MAG TPA: hypothetical protein VGM92_01160 [Candidatus Kapabacteria bacterium]